MKNHINFSFIGFLFALLLVSCNEEDAVTYQLNTTFVEFKCGNTFALVVSPTSSNLTYTSLNTNIATVTSSGVVKAGLVGTTKVVVKDSQAGFVDTARVVVTSNNLFFQDPYLGFGSNETTVRNNVNMEVFTSATEDGLFRLTYQSQDLCINWWTYYFRVSKLCKVQATASNTYKDDVQTHLLDRYMQLATKVYVYTGNNRINTDQFLLNPDSTLLIVVSTNESSASFEVIYYPANRSTIDIILSDSVGYIRPE